jgi:hypothetical protein
MNRRSTLTLTTMALLCSGIALPESTAVAQTAPAVPYLNDPRPAQPSGMSAAEVALQFAQSAPKILEIVGSAPPTYVGQSYLSVAYKINSIQHFVPQGMKFIIFFGDTSQSVTKDNADAYVKGYSDTLAIHGQAIRRRGFRKVGGDFVMKVGPNCQQKGFTDGAVSIAQADFALKFKMGWVAQFEGVVVEDTITIGAPDHDIPDVIGLGKIEAGGLVELNFGDCDVTLTPS